MKSLFFVSVFLLYSLCAPAQLYELNAKKSSVAWTGYGEVGQYSQTGTLKCKKGNLQYREGKLISGRLVLDMESITHNDRKLEKHLKADDFFDVNNYPTAIFDIISGNTNRAYGLLTLHGISDTIFMNIQIDEEGEDFTIKGEMTIDRTIFDIKYNSSTYFQDLGSYAIKNEFDIEISLIYKPIVRSKSDQ